MFHQLKTSYWTVLIYVGKDREKRGEVSVKQAETLLCSEIIQYSESILKYKEREIRHIFQVRYEHKNYRKWS